MYEKVCRFSHNLELADAVRIHIWAMYVCVRQVIYIFIGAVGMREIMWSSLHR